VAVRGMVVLLLVTSRPRTMSALGGGSAAGPSHSRPISHWDLTSAFGAKRKWAGGRVRCLGR